MVMVIWSNHPAGLVDNLQLLL